MPNTNITYFRNNTELIYDGIERPYYLAMMSIKKLQRFKKRAGISFKNPYCSGCKDYHGPVGRFSAEEILTFPKYLRRGLEYGGEKKSCCDWY